MALQRHHRNHLARAARSHNHGEQLLLHASILTVALLVASIRFIG